MTPDQPAMDAMMKRDDLAKENKIITGLSNALNGGRWHYMDPDTVAAYGPWYRAEDYDALAAEARHEG